MIGRIRQEEVKFKIENGPNAKTKTGYIHICIIYTQLLPDIQMAPSPPCWPPHWGLSFPHYIKSLVLTTFPIVYKWGNFILIISVLPWRCIFWYGCWQQGRTQAIWSWWLFNKNTLGMGSHWLIFNKGLFLHEYRHGARRDGVSSEVNANSMYKNRLYY